MKTVSFLLSLVFLSYAAPTFADNGDNARLIGNLIGGVIGTIIDHGQDDHDHIGWGGPGFPGHGPGFPGHGPGFPGHGPGFPGHGPGPGPGWPGPGPGPGWPGPGPGPGPFVDLCSGVYTDGNGQYLQLTETGNGTIQVMFVDNNRYSYYGNGNCFQDNYGGATIDFALVFNNVLYSNQGTIFLSADGHTYLTASQNGGPQYQFYR